MNKNNSKNQYYIITIALCIAMFYLILLSYNEITPYPDIAGELVYSNNIPYYMVIIFIVFPLMLALEGGSYYLEAKKTKENYSILTFGESKSALSITMNSYFAILITITISLILFLLL